MSDDDDWESDSGDETLVLLSTIILHDVDEIDFDELILNMLKHAWHASHMEALVEQIHFSLLS